MLSEIVQCLQARRCETLLLTASTAMFRRRTRTVVMSLQTLKEGQLYKKGKINTEWRQRLFILNGKQLAYFKGSVSVCHFETSDCFRSVVLIMYSIGTPSVCRCCRWALAEQDRVNRTVYMCVCVSVCLSARRLLVHAVYQSMAVCVGPVG